jgi:hypothetical protein
MIAHVTVLRPFQKKHVYVNSRGFDTDFPDGTLMSALAAAQGVYPESV